MRWRVKGKDGSGRVWVRHYEAESYADAERTALSTGLVSTSRPLWFRCPSCGRLSLLLASAQPCRRCRTAASVRDNQSRQPDLINECRDSLAAELRQIPSRQSLDSIVARFAARGLDDTAAVREPAFERHARWLASHAVGEDSELELLRHSRSLLGLTSLDSAATLTRAERQRHVYLIITRPVPIIYVAGVNLKPGERTHFATDGIGLYQRRVVGTDYASASAGATFVSRDGLALSVGQAVGRAEDSWDDVQLGVGRVVFTSDRLLFVARRPLEIRWPDVERFARTSRGMELVASTVGGEPLLFTGDGEELCAFATACIRNRSDIEPDRFTKTPSPA